MEKTEKTLIWTITSIFYVPLLHTTKDSLVNNGFLNAYIEDGMREHDYKNVIFLLFKPTNMDRFREFLDGEYERTPDIVEDYDIIGGYVVVVYNINMKWETDLNLIRKGKYSKTSFEFQKEFPQVKEILVNGLRRDELSLQWKIFKRSTDLIEYWENKLGEPFVSEELWSGWQEENETLTEEKLKEYE